MRAYDNGCFFTVLCTESDVAQFAATWPCFGDVKTYWFQFDKRNGDLVDTNHLESDANGSAIAALSLDAMAYGARRLRLRDVLAQRVMSGRI